MRATGNDPAPRAMANSHSCQFCVDTRKKVLMGVTMMITCVTAPQALYSDSKVLLAL